MAQKFANKEAEIVHLRKVNRNMRRRMRRAIEHLCEEALNAVGHVGAANYHERQTEANQWVEKASDAAFEALEADDEGDLVLPDGPLTLEELGAKSRAIGHVLDLLAKLPAERNRIDGVLYTGKQREGLLNILDLCAQMKFEEAVEFLDKHKLGEFFALTHELDCAWTGSMRLTGRTLEIKEARKQ